MDLTSLGFYGSVGLALTAMLSDVGTSDPPGRGWCAILGFASILIAASEIFGHLRHYAAGCRGSHQRAAVRILLLVPINVGLSHFRFFQRRHSDGFIEALRDAYEGYVIYNFFCLLLEINGGVNEAVVYWKARKPSMPHLFPLTGFMSLDKSAIKLWRVLVLQYAVLSPLLTMAASFVAPSRVLLPEQSWSIVTTHLILNVCRCGSMTVCFTAILYLYLATKYNIHDMQPTMKLVSVAGLVYLGCWQTVAATVMERFRVFPEDAVRWFLFHDDDPLHTEAAVSALENFLIIAEYFAASSVFHFALNYRCFSSSATQSPNAPLRPEEPEARLPFWQSVLDVFNLSKVAEDVVETTAEAAPEPGSRLPARLPGGRGPALSTTTHRRF